METGADRVKNWLSSGAEMCQALEAEEQTLLDRLVEVRRLLKQLRKMVGRAKGEKLGPRVLAHLQAQFPRDLCALDLAKALGADRQAVTMTLARLAKVKEIRRVSVGQYAALKKAHAA